MDMVEALSAAIESLKETLSPDKEEETPTVEDMTAELAKPATLTDTLQPPDLIQQETRDIEAETDGIGPPFDTPASEPGSFPPDESGVSLPALGEVAVDVPETGLPGPVQFRDHARPQATSTPHSGTPAPDHPGVSHEEAEEAVEHAEIEAPPLPERERAKEYEADGVNTSEPEPMRPHGTVVLPTDNLAVEPAEYEREFNMGRIGTAPEIRGGRTPHQISEGFSSRAGSRGDAGHEGYTYSQDIADFAEAIGDMFATMSSALRDVTDQVHRLDYDLQRIMINRGPVA